jgi:coenzyme PQQ precursor peptide PqqA
MAWTKPSIREIACGMEVNMYGPDSADDAGGDLLWNMVCAGTF